MPFPAAPTAPSLSSPVGQERVDQQQLAVAQRSEDYLRRIHWWVRLFGVVWLAGILLAVLGFLTVTAVAAYQSSREANQIESPVDTSTTNDTGTQCSIFDAASHQWRAAPCD